MNENILMGITLTLAIADIIFIGVQVRRMKARPTQGKTIVFSQEEINRAHQRYYDSTGK